MRGAAGLVALALVSGVTGHEPGPPPLPPVVSVVEVGAVGQNPAIRGRDGTFSASFDRRSVWTFGDTALSVPGGDGDSWDDNSMSWTGDLEASDGLALDGDVLDPTGAPGEFLPLTDRERRYNWTHDPEHCTQEPCGAEFSVWGGSIVADPDRHRLLVFYPEVWRIPGQPGWRTVGTGIAVGTPEEGFVRPVVDPGSPEPTLMWKANETGFAGGAVVVGSTLFAYGCHPGFLVQHCAVGRVPMARALDPTAWRYFAGTDGWSSSPADAVTVFDGGAAGNSVFFDAFLGEYVAVYSGVFSNDVHYRVSRTPWGPWSDEGLLFTGRPGWHGQTDYAAMAHPEFAEGDGQVQYVAYYHVTGLLQSDLPLVRVEFGLP